MNRDEFMELVYETFAEEPDNVLANGVIEAADAYVEHEKTQLSKGGTTSDMISREAVIDLLKQMRKDGDMVPWEGKNVFARIRKLPSAQPETLTDKEQRIFLAAMGREEKVCRQVDDECGDCRDSDSLVRTCHEITRKVKGTLWT